MQPWPPFLLTHRPSLQQVLVQCERAIGVRYRYVLRGRQRRGGEERNKKRNLFRSNGWRGGNFYIAGVLIRSCLCGGFCRQQPIAVRAVSCQVPIPFPFPSFATFFEKEILESRGEQKTRTTIGWGRLLFPHLRHNLRGRGRKPRMYYINRFSYLFRLFGL
jgi:hypothetical protein